MSRHTPGPWEIVPINAVGPDFEVVGSEPEDKPGKHGNHLVALVYSTGSGGTIFTPAIGNARLIAAAPDLLAACKAMIEFDSYDAQGEAAAWKLAEAAIARVESTED